MKKWAIYFSIVLLSGCQMRVVVTSPSPTPIIERAFEKPLLGLSVNEVNLSSFTFEDKKYRIAWTLVQDPSLVMVGVNTSPQASSSGIYTKLACTTLTNAAFYGLNSKPIGLIISQGKTVSPWQENQLFNGILGWSHQSLTIQSEPQPEYDWAVQAGPLLVADGKPRQLRLIHDELARRVVAGVTTTSQLFLATILAENSLFDGPLLQDMPQIVLKVQDVLGLTLESAINLDGGTASAFINSNLSLKELKPIGSWICVK